MRSFSEHELNNQINDIINSGEDFEYLDNDLQSYDDNEYYNDLNLEE